MPQTYPSSNSVVNEEQNSIAEIDEQPEAIAETPVDEAPDEIADSTASLHHQGDILPVHTHGQLPQALQLPICSSETLVLHPPEVSHNTYDEQLQSSEELPLSSTTSTCQKEQSAAIPQRTTGLALFLQDDHNGY